MTDALKGLGWAALASATMIGGILFFGEGEETLPRIVRATARLASVAFAVTFVAVAPARFEPGLFVAFALVHTVHLGAVATLVGATRGESLAGARPVAIVGGALAYLFILTFAGMHLTRPAPFTGALAVIRTVGLYYVWLAFTLAYVSRSIVEPGYLPLAAILFAALVVRLWVATTGRSARR